MKKNDRIAFRLNKELIYDLNLISELEGETISFIVRTVLQDYVNYYMYRNIQEYKIVENEYFENIKSN